MSATSSGTESPEAWMDIALRAHAGADDGGATATPAQGVDATNGARRGSGGLPRRGTLDVDCAANQDGRRSLGHLAMPRRTSYPGWRRASPNWDGDSLDVGYVLSLLLLPKWSTAAA